MKLFLLPALLAFSLFAQEADSKDKPAVSQPSAEQRAIFWRKAAQVQFDARQVEDAKKKVEASAAVFETYKAQLCPGLVYNLNSQSGEPECLRKETPKDEKK